MITDLWHRESLDAVLDFIEDPTAEKRAMLDAQLEKHPPIKPLVPSTLEEKAEIMDALVAGGVTLVNRDADGVRMHSPQPDPPASPPKRKRKGPQPGAIN